MENWGGLILFSYIVSLLGAGLYVEAVHEHKVPAVRLGILLFWFIYVPISILVNTLGSFRAINQRRTS